jgi:hypothetical protein
MSALDTKVALQGRFIQRAATLPLPEGRREPASVEYLQRPNNGPVVIDNNPSSER